MWNLFELEILTRAARPAKQDSKPQTSSSREQHHKAEPSEGVKKVSGKLSKQGKSFHVFWCSLFIFPFLLNVKILFFFPLFLGAYGGAHQKRVNTVFLCLYSLTQPPRLLLNIQKITIFHLLVFIRNFHRLRPRQSFFGWFFFPFVLYPWKMGLRVGSLTPRY